MSQKANGPLRGEQRAGGKIESSQQSNPIIPQPPKNSSPSIVRVKKNSSYFVASNEPFNDPNLSWEAAGVMGYLLSKPDHWQLREADLINQRRAGKSVIRRIMGELKRGGYVHRHQERVTDGTFTTITTVYESPTLNPHLTATQKSGSGITAARFTDSGSAAIGSAACGKPGHIETTESETTESDNNNKQVEIFEIFQSEIGPLTPAIRKKIAAATALYPPAWIPTAITRAVEMNRRHWGYVTAILKNWSAVGGPEHDHPPTRESKKTGSGESPHERKNSDPAGWTDSRSPQQICIVESLRKS